MRRYLIQLGLLFLFATPALGAITVDGTGTATANATTIAVGITSGSVAVGDILFAFITTRVEVAGFPDRIVPPTAGWALLTTDTTDAPSASFTNHLTVFTFVRVADASDVSKPTYTFSPFTWSTGSGLNVAQTGMINAHLIAMTGLNSKYWIDDHRSNITITASGTLNGPPVSNMSSANDAHLIYWAFDQAATGITITTPAGYTSQPAGILSNTAASPDLYSQLFYNATPTFTNHYTPALTSTMSANTGSSIGVSLTLLPAGVQPYGTVEEPFQVGNIAKAPPLPPDAGSHATYYVDSNVSGYNGQAAPTGSCLANDSNNGTSTATPWCTMAKVNAQSFLPGDLIIFKCGDTWRETLKIKTAWVGTSVNNIYFSSDPTGAWGSCTYGAPVLGPKGYVTGNLPTITGSDVVGTGGNIITSAWTQCGSSDANCGTNSNANITNVWWENINTSYSINNSQNTGGSITCQPGSVATCGSPIDALYVTDVTPACSGPACPSLGVSPGWGLTRAADLPGTTTAAPGPLAVAFGAGSANGNGGADSNGSAAQGAMTAGSWAYYPTPSGDVATNTMPVASGSSATAITAGRLYLWLGDSSNPNSHTIEPGVREYDISGVQGVESGFSGSSFITFNGLNLIRANGMIYGYNLSRANGLRSGQRYITVEWSSHGQGASAVDTNASYHNGIMNSDGTNWLMRHNSVAYTGDHGNNSNMQNMDYVTLEYEDHTHGNHDQDDVKAVDGVIVRWANIHDGIVEPVFQPAYAGNAIEGTYMESQGSNDNRTNWINGTTVNPYYQVDSDVYFSQYYNFVPGGTRLAPNAIHFDALMGLGNFIANNSSYANGQTSSNGQIYVTGGVASTVYNVYCNSMHWGHVGSNSLVFSGSGTLNEDADNLGLHDDSSAGTASLASGSLGANAIKNDPKYNHPSTVYDLSPLVVSPNLNKCNTADGLATFIGAFPSPPWSLINAANGPTFP